MAAGDQKLKPKSGRKPLHPINSPVNITPKLKSKPEWTDQNQGGDLNLNKENNQQVVPKMETLDASLAEELTAIRKKMERLRLDKDKTDKMLDDRAAAMEAHFKQIHQRGEIQKTLELEVDRLYRLNQLKSYCKRITSIRTLREKEEEKRTGEGEAVNSQCQYQEEEEEESVGENSPCPSPCSSELVVTEKEE